MKCALSLGDDVHSSVATKNRHGWQARPQIL